MIINQIIFNQFQPQKEIELLICGAVMQEFCHFVSKKCSQQYIEETEKMLRERFSEHKTYVNTNNKSKSTGIHFNQKGHSVSDMEISIIEKVFNKDPRYRKQREKLYIQKFNTRYRGLNRLNGGWNLQIANPFFKKRYLVFYLVKHNLFLTNVHQFWSSLMWEL